MKLVIVESPTKAKTISRFLGNDFIVESSYGHVRDLPKSKLGVDTEKNFSPTYVTPPRAKKAITTLRKAAKKSDGVILATDEDREGEAIAWHVAHVLKLKKNDMERIVFHEITDSAIKEALKKPRTLDDNLIDAQQARRVLDRLVGYKLSPLLWKKVMRGLSAGRVQSVAVRLIVEREREREAFDPQEYWSLDARLTGKENKTFEASLWKKDGTTVKKHDIGSKKEVDGIIETATKGTWRASAVSSSEKKRNPSPPFTTSTLQQQASHRLYFSAGQTMRVAQQLYEGVELGSGQEGLITYMRTDSLNLSAASRKSAESFITSNYGKEYAKPRTFKTKKKGAQEAHEAVRPTDPTRTPNDVKKYLDARQLKLYTLIWERFIASQMAPAVFDATTIEIETDTPYSFKATGIQTKFDGFLKVWKSKTNENILPAIKEGETLTLKKLVPERHETQPPPRYSEATLVKALEEHGIGRPSTYAPIMSTIQQRKYVEKESRHFKPTKIGRIVNDFLVEHFPKIVDIEFTARLEEDLDKIAEGKKEWVPVIKNFYEPFEKRLEEKEESIERSDVTSIKDLGTDPKTGKPLTVRIGRYGPYIQKGDKDDDEKPAFAPVPPDMELEQITKEQALKLFELPRTLGKVSKEDGLPAQAGDDILVNIGRYGPYVKIGKTYASLGEEADPFLITKNEALTIFKDAEEEKKKAILQTFDEGAIEVKNGRYGPYVTDGTTNATVPKGKDPEKITEKEAKELLEKKRNKKGGYKKGKKKGRKKKK